MPGETFELSIALSNLRGAVHEAGHEGTLRAELSIAFFKDHSVVHTSNHLLGDDLRISAPVTVERPGKYHVTVALFAGAA